MQSTVEGSFGGYIFSWEWLRALLMLYCGVATRA